MSKSAFNRVTGESHADTLAAEFCVVFNGAGNVVHVNTCAHRRVKFGQHRTEAHADALRQGFQIAPCCAGHEGRLLTLGARVGAW